jgi:hypothetical protein
MPNVVGHRLSKVVRMQLVRDELGLGESGDAITVMNDDVPSRSEQRRDPRRSLMLRVDVSPGSSPDAEALAAAWTADVSAGGVSLRGASMLQRGQIVRMRLSFPGLLDPMDVLGDVVWSQRSLAITGGVGVRVWSSLDRQRLAHLAEITDSPGLRRSRPYRIVLLEVDPLAALTYRIGLDDLHPVVAGQLEIAMARSWSEARERVEQAPADLIMLGLHAKYHDSIEALGYVRNSAQLAGSMVVALVHGDDPQLLEQASLIADATFKKPVPIARVVETIGHLLNRKTAKQAAVGYV